MVCWLLTRSWVANRLEVNDRVSCRHCCQANRSTNHLRNRPARLQERTWMSTCVLSCLCNLGNLVLSVEWLKYSGDTKISVNIHTWNLSSVRWYKWRGEGRGGSDSSEGRCLSQQLDRRIEALWILQRFNLAPSYMSIGPWSKRSKSRMQAVFMKYLIVSLTTLMASSMAFPIINCRVLLFQWSHFTLK